MSARIHLTRDRRRAGPNFLKNINTSLNELPGTERPRVVLVGVDFSQGARAGGRSTAVGAVPGPAFDAALDELALLAQSAGDDPVLRMVAKRRAPDPALFVGSGKADEIKTAVALYEARAVIFDQALGPAQQRNLERFLGVEVIDRTMLILEIFAARARSHEGKLQVELAKLQYLSTRLVRRWSHLERQQGGVGVRGGPGETQIELDRRMIEVRIKQVKERLERVKKQRHTQRRSRERHGVFRVSLVGYTNAGKSTLFNALVKAKTYAADQLFATLDTTTRQMYLEEAGRSVSLSDTVGFIRDLPHTLVDAFQATLQEAAEADLLLHVADASAVNLRDQIQEVQRVLRGIGADDVPQILVFNKIDALEESQAPRVGEDVFELEAGRSVPRVFVSAQRGTGLDALRKAIAQAALATPPSAPGSALPDEPEDPRSIATMTEGLVGEPLDIETILVRRMPEDPAGLASESESSVP